ncbi:MAG: methyltransferase domain-containing protein [Magnetococcales bacterium]|nr:methyltransferase domain-containing protein [Magnetococcales bacterium]
MAIQNFITPLHTRAQRDYVARVVEHDKAACATIAKQWGAEYWDGPRQYGYGGYRYDGRWLPVAQRMAAHYGLTPESRVLDVGCGKGYLLYEFTRAVPGITVAGLDLSSYALTHAKPELKPHLTLGNATALPYADHSFDLVYSITTLHNLYAPQLDQSLREMQRVGKGHKLIVVESYRNEREKANLLYWQLTCESFFTPEEWQWWFDRCGYDGDAEFIYFE